MLKEYPMSESYPQEAGKIELRKIMKVLKEDTSGSKVDTTVELEEDERWTLDWILKKIVGTEAISEPIDEVDGRTDEILRPLVKLYFLKILFIDIGITLGDLVTDFAQGLNLIFDNNWNIHWSTIHYGCIVLGFIWLPVIPMLIHVFTHKTRKYFVESESNTALLIGVLKFVIFFPLLPSIMYMRILILRKSFTTNRERLKFMEFEQKTTELKSIAGSIESTLQFTLMLWMMSRGILTLPWDQSLSSSCVEDSLGRVACLPSIPMLSLLFSLLSILKSALDINLIPYVSCSLNNIAKAKVCQHFVLCFLPFFLCNILFRLPAYAFIMTFLDYWSIIPAVILYIVHLACCGLFFIKQENMDNQGIELPMDNIMSESTGTINLVTTDDEGRTDTRNEDRESHPAKAVKSRGKSSELIWNGKEWMSTSVCVGDTSNKNTERQLSRNSDFESSGNNNEEKENFEINERNTPLFLNSVSGFFYPSVNSTLVIKSGYSCLRILQDFQKWQLQIIMTQVLIFNCAALIIVIVIFILVTFVDSFNYKGNIMDSFWFSMMTLYLLLIGVIGAIWSFQVFPESKFPLMESVEEEEIVHTEKENNEMKTKRTVRRRHITGESKTDSICSENHNFLYQEKGPNKIKTRFIYCLAASFLVLTPSILGVFLYKFLPKKQIFLTFAYQDQNQVNLDIIESRIFQFENNFQILENDPEFIRNLTESVFDQDKFNMSILLDNRPEERWRISSPIWYHQNQKHENIIIKGRDFAKIRKKATNLAISKNITVLPVIINYLSKCSSSSLIYINRDKKDSHSSLGQYKYFLDGHLYENWKVRSVCYINGEPCQYDFNDYTQIKCEQNIIDGTEFVDFSKNEKLERVQIIYNENTRVKYCCLNSSNIIEIFGRSDVSRKLIQSSCNKNKWLEERSPLVGVRTYFQLCQIGDYIVKESFRSDKNNNTLTICEEIDNMCF